MTGSKAIRTSLLVFGPLLLGIGCGISTAQAAKTTGSAGAAAPVISTAEEAAALQKPETQPAPDILPSPAFTPPPGDDTPGVTPMDLAYGAFQRGWYITAAVRAKPLADKGNIQAQTLLGVLYEAGLGFKKDPEKAAHWYAKATEGGDLSASQQLAQLYLLGNGVKQDISKAADLFEKAADKGDAAATYNMALIYQEGKGRPQDTEKAARLLKQAAEGNYAEAQYHLALSYLEAAHQQKDPDDDPNTLRQAAFWMGRAARRDHVEAQVYYGIMRFRGEGVVEDRREGADWFERAANSGNAIAMNRLARCYASGKGRDIDPVMALKWHYIARSKGVEDPQLDALAGRLDEDSVKAAQELAEAFTGTPITLAQNTDATNQ